MWSTRDKLERGAITSSTPCMRQILLIFDKNSFFVREIFEELLSHIPEQRNTSIQIRWNLKEHLLMLIQPYCEYPTNRVCNIFTLVASYF